jgi:hypothetical protein
MLQFKVGFRIRALGAKFNSSAKYGTVSFLQQANTSAPASPDKKPGQISALPHTISAMRIQSRVIVSAVKEIARRCQKAIA